MFGRNPRHRWPEAHSSGTWSLVVLNRFREKRRILTKDITRVSVSPYADCFVVLHVAKEYDYCFVLERKSEMLTALADSYKSLTGNTLSINFATEITVNTKEKKGQTLSFVKSDSARYERSHAHKDSRRQSATAASRGDSIAAFCG